MDERLPYRAIAFPEHRGSRHPWTILGPWVYADADEFGCRPGLYRPHIAQVAEESMARRIEELLNTGGIT
jgi:hypothetical protein